VLLCDPGDIENFVQNDFQDDKFKHPFMKMLSLPQQDLTLDGKVIDFRYTSSEVSERPENTVCAAILYDRLFKGPEKHMRYGASKYWGDFEIDGVKRPFVLGDDILDVYTLCRLLEERRTAEEGSNEGEGSNEDGESDEDEESDEGEEEEDETEDNEEGNKESGAVHKESGAVHEEAGASNKQSEVMDKDEYLRQAKKHILGGRVFQPKPGSLLDDMFIRTD
jgi:hypothetical protein